MNNTIKVKVTPGKTEATGLSVNVTRPESKEMVVSVNLLNEETPPTLYRPKRYNKNQLDRAGVELLDRGFLLCKNCGISWSPNVRTGGKMTRGYWKCPNGCNAEAE